MKSTALLLILLVGWVVMPVAAADRTHTVQPGDSLSRMVWLYGVSTDRIIEVNQLASTELRPGQTLIIPGDSTTAVQPEPAQIRAAEPVVPRALPAVPVISLSEPERPAPSVAAAEDPPAPPGASGFRSAIAIPAAKDIRYNGRWVPPGESTAWVMDCSNTSRWLYRYVKGVDLPRTASGQYEWLRERKRLWRAQPDAASLRKRLQPGDLLFWEHTYKPPRTPPVTHVMVYLGTDASGRMQMAGSQGARGLDVYTFEPSLRMGGYRFFFFFRRDGKFVAYGRP